MALGEQHNTACRKMALIRTRISRLSAVQSGQTSLLGPSQFFKCGFGNWPLTFLPLGEKRFQIPCDHRVEDGGFRTARMIRSVRINLHVHRSSASSRLSQSARPLEHPASIRRLERYSRNPHPARWRGLASLFGRAISYSGSQRRVLMYRSPISLSRVTMVPLRMRFAVS